MIKKLYIIGNGFDIHHGIASEYIDFGMYLKANYLSLYHTVDEYFEVSDYFWNKFEERLAWFDTDKLMDLANDFLVPYGADDWSDADHHTPQFEVNRVVNELSIQLRAAFAEWIRQLYIPNKMDVKADFVNLDKNAIFLNFNYTDTLEKIYDVSPNNIFHIHGYAKDSDEKIILGHGWELEPDEMHSTHNSEDTDVRIAESRKILDGYFSKTFKPSVDIIKHQSAFFNNLRTVQEVFVMGHSLGEVDHIYFSEIISQTMNNSTKWKVSYHGELGDKPQTLEQLGVRPNLMEFLDISHF